MRIDAMAFDDAGDLLRERHVGKRLERYVDTNFNVMAGLQSHAADFSCFTDYAASQHVDLAAVFYRLHEGVRHDDAVLRMAPPREGFGADDRARLHVDLGLEV